MSEKKIEKTEDIPELAVYLQVGDDKRHKIGQIELPEGIDADQLMSMPMVDFMTYTMDQQAKICEKFAKDCREVIEQMLKEFDHAGEAKLTLLQLSRALLDENK